MKIGIIVYADDKPYANALGLEIITDLEQKEIFHGHSDIIVMNAASKRGQQFIQDRLEAQKLHFMDNLKHLRDHLVHTSDEELWQRSYADGNVDCICMRHRAWSVGQYEGRHIFLYGNDGEGIQEPEHLECVLNKWACIYDRQLKPNPYDDLGIYVVSMVVSE